MPRILRTTVGLHAGDWREVCIAPEAQAAPGRLGMVLSTSRSCWGAGLVGSGRGQGSLALRHADRGVDFWTEI